MAAVARRGELVDDFAGEPRLFRLNTGLLEEIEAATGRGIFAIFDRAFSGAWTLNEVRAVLLHGLIGGGTAAKEAEALIAAHLTAETAMQYQGVARGVLGVALAPDLATDADRGARSKKATGGDPPTGSQSGS